MKNNRLVQKPQVISSEIVYENPRFKIRKDRLIWPDGTSGEFYLTEHPPYVMIIAEQDGKLLAIEQYRYQTDAVMTELPGGIIDANESAEDAAQRELLEETGYAASKITKLGVFNAYGRIRGNVCIAHGLVKRNEPKLAASEFGMTNLWIPVDEWRAMIAYGRITMYSTLAAWALYLAWKEKNLILAT